MTLTQINNGDGTRTLRFDYTAANTKIVSGANHAAKFLYNRLSPAEKAALAPTFAQLTDPQKATLIDNAVHENLKAWSEADIRSDEEQLHETTLQQRFSDEGLG